MLDIFILVFIVNVNISSQIPSLKLRSGFSDFIEIVRIYLHIKDLYGLSTLSRVVVTDSMLNWLLVKHRE